MSLEDDIRLLRSLAIFQAFEPEALRILAFSAARRGFRPGDTLFRRGEPSDGGFVILQGSVVCDPSDDGRPSAFVFGPGCLIGESALLALTERPATALAREATLVLFVSRELMTRVLEAHPQTAAAVHRLQARRIGAIARDFSTITGSSER